MTDNELLQQILAKLTNIEERVTTLNDTVAEFAEQVEESVIRIENAASTPSGDY